MGDGGLMSGEGGGGVAWVMMRKEGMLVEKQKPKLDGIVWEIKFQRGKKRVMKIEEYDKEKNRYLVSST